MWCLWSWHDEQARLLSKNIYQSATVVNFQNAKVVVTFLRIFCFRSHSVLKHISTCLRTVGEMQPGLSPFSGVVLFVVAIMHFTRAKHRNSPRCAITPFFATDWITSRNWFEHEFTTSTIYPSFFDVKNAHTIKLTTPNKRSKGKWHFQTT